MSLAAEIAAWYGAVYKPAWGSVAPYAVAMIPSSSPYFPTVISQARSREEAIGAMRMAQRPSVQGAFLAIIGPWGIEGTRA